MDRRYFVYALFDQRVKGKWKFGEYEFAYLPFYVGKGVGGRHRRHSREALRDHLPEGIRINLKKMRRIKEIFSDTGQEPLTVKLHVDLTEAEAFGIEVFAIAQIGLAKDGDGPLLNRTLGGEGGLGASRKPYDAKRSRRMSRVVRAAAEQMTDAKKAEMKANWYRATASRTPEKQAEVRAKAKAAARSRWDSMTPAQRIAHAEERGKETAERLKARTPEDVIRFKLKCAAGHYVRPYGFDRQESRRVRKKIAAAINAMDVGSGNLESLKRKVQKLVVSSACVRT